MKSTRRTSAGRERNNVSEQTLRALLLRIEPGDMERREFVGQLVYNITGGRRHGQDMFVLWWNWRNQIGDAFDTAAPKAVWSSCEVTQDPCYAASDLAACLAESLGLQIS